jgi:hypothetical protein
MDDGSTGNGTRISHVVSSSRRRVLIRTLPLGSIVRINPLISLIDHVPATSAGMIVYGEASCSDHNKVLQDRNREDSHCLPVIYFFCPPADMNSLLMSAPEDMLRTASAARALIESQV